MLLSRKLTEWTVTTLPVVFQTNENTGSVADWHPRMTSEELIAYDSAGGGQGLATKTVYGYDGDFNQRATPLNVNRATQYASVTFSD